MRLVAPQQVILLRPDLWQPAERLGWNRRPDIDIRINTGERTVRVVTDTFGYRIAPEGRGSGRPVLVLGDSFMEALQVEYAESAPGLLEAALSEAVGEAVAVRNAAVGGWDPSQYLLQARASLAREPVAAVLIAFYVGNDVVRIRRDSIPPRQATVRHRLRVPRRLAAAEFVDAVLYPINDFLEVRSHLFILARSNLSALRMRLGLHPRTFADEFLKATAAESRWEVAADLCRDIAAAAGAQGARTVVVLVPDAIQVAPGDLAVFLRGYGLDTATVDLEQPNRLMTEALRDRGLTVVDPLPAFRAAHAAGMRTHGRVDAHLTPDGHRLLTEAILPFLAAALDR